MDRETTLSQVKDTQTQEVIDWGSLIAAACCIACIFGFLAMTASASTQRVEKIGEVIVNRSGDIVEWNAESLTGWIKEAGIPFEMYLSAMDRPAWRACLGEMNINAPPMRPIWCELDCRGGTVQVTLWLKKNDEGRYIVVLLSR